MRNKYSSPVIKALVFIIDYWLIKLGFSLTKKIGLAHGLPEDQFISFLLIFSLIWIVAGFFYKIYRIDSVSLMRSISINLFNALLIHLFLVVMILTSFNVYKMSTPFLFCAYLFSATFLVASRVIYKLIWKYVEFSGFDKRTLVIIGVTGSGKALYEFFATNHE
jgi:FlaA1/EpsC-like NDP-sugar epimerase